MAIVRFFVLGRSPWFEESDRLLNQKLLDGKLKYHQTVNKGLSINNISWETGIVSIA
jgi:hypothetical protein